MSDLWHGIFSGKTGDFIKLERMDSFYNTDIQNPHTQSYKVLQTYDETGTNVIPSRTVQPGDYIFHFMVQANSFGDALLKASALCDTTMKECDIE